MKKQIKKLTALVAAMGVSVLAGCSAPPEGVKPITGFEAERYMGKWYEVARLDHSFERGLKNVTADYALNDDGSVRVLNKGQDEASCEWSEAEGRAEFLGAPDIASLKVTFFWPFSGGYHVVMLDEDYTSALVAGPSFEYLWLLSRTPEMDEGLQAAYLKKADALGFDTGQLIFVSQENAPCAPAS